MTRRSKTPDAPDHEPEIEAALIASALIDQDAVDAIAALPAELWYTERHRKIAAAIRSAGAPDTIAIMLALRDAGHLAEIGGMAELARLETDALPWVAVEAHVPRLRAALARRVMAQQLTRASVDLERGATPGSLAVTLAQATLTAEHAGALPTGYYIGEDGDLWREGDEEPVRVAPCLITLAGRAVDVTTGSHVVTLRWPVAGRMTEHVYAREHVAVSRKLAEVGAAVGLPVTSESAREVVRYVAACEESLGVPVVRSARQTGWHGDAYLRGAHQHGADCPEWMRHVSREHDGLIDAIAERGEWATWEDMALRARSYPAVGVALLASLSAPLVQILGAPSYCLHLGSDTSGGKTSAMEIALSAWGDPSRLTMTWDATPVAIELTAAALSGLPILLDDTMRAARREDCGRVVYTVTQGVGRARGGPGGATGAVARPAARWRTVLLSTGEGPMPAAADAGGARARILHIGTPPWGRRDLGETVRELTGIARRHHGHAGRRLIDHITALSDDDRAELRAEWQEATSRWSRTLAVMVPGSAVVDRIAQHLATLEVTGRTVEAALGWEAHDWLPRTIVDTVASTLGEVDRARMALEHAYSWTVARIEQFAEAPPVGGYLGAATRHLGELRSIAWLPSALQSELERAGYDYAATLQTWRGRGWVAYGSDGRLERVSIGGARVRAVRLTPEALGLIAETWPAKIDIEDALIP